VTTLAQLSSGQYNKETIANENFGAVSPAGLFGKKYSTTTGLTLGYYGGIMMIDGVLTSIADGTVALTASQTNYVEATRAGTVLANYATGWTAGRIQLFEILTGSSSISSITDLRPWAAAPHVGSYLSKAFPSDANYTLTMSEARARMIRMSGTLGAQRNVVVPLNGDWMFYNNTAGGFGIQIIGASGTGIVIANGTKAFVYGDGTNILRATADV
jgi:hypothetical protein